MTWSSNGFSLNPQKSTSMKVKQGNPFPQAIIPFLPNKRRLNFLANHTDFKVFWMELSKNIHRDHMVQKLCIVTNVYLCVCVGFSLLMFWPVHISSPTVPQSGRWWDYSRCVKVCGLHPGAKCMSEQSVCLRETCLSLSQAVEKVNLYHTKPNWNTYKMLLCPNCELNL